jgi:hypothetical protein
MASSSARHDTLFFVILSRLDVIRQKMQKKSALGSLVWRKAWSCAYPDSVFRLLCLAESMKLLHAFRN